MKHNKVAFAWYAWVICLVVSVILGFWGAAAPVWGGDRLPVAATIVPLGNFCEQLGGDRVTVQVLIPPGASPHIFEPAPSAVNSALKAKVFVYVGAGLEPWAARLLNAHPAANRQVVEAVAGVELIQDEPSAHTGRENQHSHGKPSGHHHTHLQGNPHVWLDPVLVQELCRKIAQALIKADPPHREYYENRLSRYLQELAALHEEISRTVAGFKVREFVSFHAAFPYFARRYGLKEAGVITPSPGREPSPKRLRDLIAAIKSYQVRAVFAEPQFSPRVAEVIAREAGVKVLFLDPLGGRPPYGADYLQLMRHNLKVMAEAMQ